MFGCAVRGDEVSYKNDNGEVCYAIVLSISDDGCWAELQDRDREDVVVLPVSKLHVCE